MSDLSPEDRAFIDLARRAPGPTRADRARVRRAITAAAPLAGLSAAASTKAASASVGLAKLSLVFVAAVGTGAGVVASAIAIHRATLNPPAAPLARPRPVVEAPVGLPAPQLELAAPIERAPTDEPPGLPKPNPPRTAAIAKRQPVAPPAKHNTPAVLPASPPDSNPPARCTVETEASVLMRAQHLLTSAPRESLENLDGLERDCPGGELVEERHAARALALCALGRKDEGLAQLEWLLHNTPSSPALPRLRNACESE
jgi:hypothetical protein